jgi:hypothetical protein
VELFSHWLPAQFLGRDQCPMCVCTRTKNDASVTVTKRAARACFKRRLKLILPLLKFPFCALAAKGERARRHGPLLMIPLPGRADGRTVGREQRPTQNTATRAVLMGGTERETQEPLIAGVCEIWTRSLSGWNQFSAVSLLCAQG